MENKLQTHGRMEEGEPSMGSPDSPSRRKTDPAPNASGHGSDVTGNEDEIPLDPDDEDPIEEELPDDEVDAPGSQNPA